MQTLSASPAVVEIKGASYTVEAIDPGFAGASAVRVTKLLSGEAYDLVRGHDGLLSCSCPDFVVRHADKGTCCKHLAHAVANDLLPVAPAPAPKPAPAVAPVTRADLKRASYFGLRLPADAARAVEPKPAPRTVPTPTPTPTPIDLANLVIIITGSPEVISVETACPVDVRELALADAPAQTPSPDPEENPRDSWPIWTDLARWELGPNASDGASSSIGSALGPMQWANISPAASVLRNLTPTRIEWTPPAVVEAPGRREPFEPTLEDLVEAAEMFADRRGSCRAGESAPPIGDRSYPRRSIAKPLVNTLRDEDHYRPGAWS